MKSLLELIFPIVLASTTITPIDQPIPPPLVQTPVIAVYEARQEAMPVVSPVEIPVKLPSNVYCSCVMTLRAEIPDLPLLDAIDYPLNTITPKVGDILKIQYYNATTSKYIYHIALIREITETDYLVYQGNKPKCATSTETISKKDERILGFFNMERQRLIDKLTPIQKETLWNESGWSMYDTKGSVLRGKDLEYGVAQFMSSTWKWLSEKRQIEKLSMLDKLNFDDQIEMFLYGWEKGVTWYGMPEA